MKVISLIILSLISNLLTAQDLSGLVSRNNPISGNQYIIDYDANNKIPKTVSYYVVEDSLGDYGRYSFHIEKYDMNYNSDYYYNTGYDKGHLFSSASSHSHTSNYESFDWINICPQKASFNRGLWKRSELFERNNSNNMIYIICGPIQSDMDTWIGDIRVPYKFFKVIYDITNNKSIGFIMTQDDSGDLVDYSRSIDEVESITGYDFMPQDCYNESSIDLNNWNW